MEIICSNCLNSFKKNEVFLATHFMTTFNENKGQYCTFYCYICIKKSKYIIEYKSLEETTSTKRMVEKNIPAYKRDKKKSELNKEEIQEIIIFKENNELLKAYFYFSTFNKIKKFKPQLIQNTP